MSKLFVTVIAALLLTACASSPNKIEATYVSPLKYKDYDCDMLALEQANIERRTNELFHSLKKESNKDTAQMTVGLLLFWPTLFFLEGGDGPEAAEYAQLKGEYVALQDVAVMKKCGITFADDLSETVTEEPQEESDDDSNL